jgi:hypothetical protein
MKYAVLLILLPAICYADSGIRLQDTSVTVVDRIEINHHHNDHCMLIFDQIIFYRFNYYSLRFDVIDWRMTKDFRKKLTDEETLQLKEDNKKRYLKEWGWKKWPEDLAVPFEPPLALSKQVDIEYRNDRVYLTWHDLAAKTKYIVIANELVHTWTQYDVELIERDYIQKERRFQLNHPVGLKKVELK